LILIIIIL